MKGKVIMNKSHESPNRSLEERVENFARKNEDVLARTAKRAKVAADFVTEISEVDQETERQPTTI